MTVSTVSATGAPTGLRRAVRWLGADGGAVWLVVVALAALLAVQSSDTFLTSDNAANLLSQLVVLALVALGQTFVVLTGGIDLSVGSLATLTAVLTAGLIDGYPIRVLPVLLLVLFIGALTGAAHGSLVSRSKMVPFVVTLASFYLLQGLAFSYTTTPVGAIPNDLAAFAMLNLGPFPAIFLVALAVFAGLAWVLSRTTFGRHVYAVGGDIDVARSAGIRTGRVTVGAYMICSMLAALAGFLLAAKATVGTPSAGSELELSAITAVVLGGTSLFGGRGRVIGTAGGVVLLALVENAFTLLHISSFYQDLVRGAVIVAAVAVFTRKD